MAQGEAAEDTHGTAPEINATFFFEWGKPVRVLVADSLEQSGLDGLAAAGCEVVYRPQLTEDALGAALRDTQADVLIVRGTPVGEAALSAGPLKLVVRAGAGYNTIDVAAASQRGIYVSNCPGRNAIAVAELAFALILALDRRLADNVVALLFEQPRRDGRIHPAGHPDDDALLAHGCPPSPYTLACVWMTSSG